jgi:hypothetical protein
MDPLTAAAVSTGVSVIGGIAANASASGDRNRANELAGQALSVLKDMGYPPDLSRKIVFEQFTQQGVMTPELEQELSAGPSRFEQVQEAPEMRLAQLEALQALQQRGKAGLGAEDRAALNQSRRMVQKDAEAKRQQILMDMQARGQSGSGAELIAQLAGNQAAQETQSQESDRLMAQAAQTALQSMQNAGTLGGQIREQDYGVMSDKARAADQMSQFNTQLSAGRQQRNVGAINESRAANLAEKQRLADINIKTRNEERLRQRASEQDEYRLNMDRARLLSGGYQDAATTAQARGDATAAQTMGVANAIGGGVNSYMKWKKDEKNASED